MSHTMRRYQGDFIEFLVQAGVLTFGDFTTKSGRQTPYFINTGNYRTGMQLDELGGFYAQAIADHFGLDFDNLYGPAYKGIPLAVTAAIALGRQGHDVSVTYNRKEAKDHGEGGSLIGHKYNGSERVIIIEDVITAGTSVRESMALLQAQGNPTVCGVIVSVDRRERGQGDLSAIEEMQQEFNLPVKAIVSIDDILNYLYGRDIDGQVYIDDDMQARILHYLSTYGRKNL